jgi:hypothetical protein
MFIIVFTKTLPPPVGPCFELGLFHNVLSSLFNIDFNIFPDLHVGLPSSLFPSGQVVVRQ